MSDSTVKVLFFSRLQELTGVHEIEIKLPFSVPLSELYDTLKIQFPSLREWKGPILFAVNLQYSTLDTVIQSGDEIALMPPVQGG